MAEVVRGPATTSEGTNTKNEAQTYLPTLGDSVNSLVTAMSSVFTSMVTEDLTSGGTMDLSQLPTFLEKTAVIFQEINKTPTDTPAADEDTVVHAAVKASSEANKQDSTVVFEDEWKLAISKSTGKVLGIFPDNALAQRWYSDEAEEEIASKNALSSYDSAVQRCREQVEIIIKECRRTNAKFRDHEFSLDEHNVCLYSLDSTKDEYPFPPQGQAQARKIFKKPQFYVDGATASDVKQGQAGDCWFLAGIASLTNFKACLTQNYVQVDGDERVGVYGFVFHRDGDWIYEIVDDHLYVKNPLYGCLDKCVDTTTLEWRMLRHLPEAKYSATFREGGDALFFAQSRDENETWLPLLEKAYAKAHGDYWSIDGGFTGEAIEDLTGGITTELRIEDILDPDVLWTELLLCNEQFIFGCWTPAWDDDSNFSEGLCSGHAYSIMKAMVVGINGECERLLLVRNPWGKSEWTGPYSDGSKEMNVTLLTKLEHETGDDGMFYMSFDDFLRKFEFLDRTRLIGNDWSCAQCWVNLKIPRTNTFLDTKYVFTMDRADQVVLSLSQLDDRYIRGLVGRYYFDLEFRLEKDEPGSSGTVIARSTRGIYTERSVNTEIYLEVGTYNVFLKVTADFIGGHSVKDIVKSYVEENKVKLVQIAKKYNFAHMKKGVGDKDDRVFESLTVEEEAKVKTDEKPKDETDTTESADNSAKEENADTADSKTSDDKSIPVPNTEPSPEVPVENPVTGEPKPVPGPETTPAEKSEKKKKDKSIENWNPVATVGLRLFTRKAKVALSVVQTAIDPSKATANTTPKMADDTKLTILVSGESAKIGNVPPIGDPLPLTPQHETKDTSALLVVDKIINLNDVTTLKLPKDNTNPAVSDTSTSSHPKENQAVIASSSSHPLAMDDGAVKEGAEKIEAAKLTVGEEAASGKIADKSAADINVAAGKSESSSESSRIDMIGTPNSGSGSGLSDGIVHEVKEEDNSAVVV